MKKGHRETRISEPERKADEESERTAVLIHVLCSVLCSPYSERLCSEILDLFGPWRSALGRNYAHVRPPRSSCCTAVAKYLR